ncbi:MAG: amidase [Geminicoccaceae bacterium]|nr:amidase [Geminicoccaceae bacterium]
MTEEVWRLDARTVVGLLARRELSPLDAVEAALGRIGAVDGRVNAVPTLDAERARARARRFMMEPPQPHGDGRGWLAGLPVLVKDLVDVAGLRTTYGSPIYGEHVPKDSAIEALRLERQGAIILGKTNTPEFGAGGNTFNEVFGPTRNPWRLDLTAGGSSGGAAAALASGMAWLCDGSDVAGSLRTPAAFCGVVGLRPSPGRVPQGPSPLPFSPLAVEGPMARNVRDLALLLDAMAGFDPLDPLSFDAPAEPFEAAVERVPPTLKVAFSADLGGITPVDGEVAGACERAAARLAEMGAEVVEDRCPDFAGAGEAFLALRAAHYAATKGPLLEGHRARLKPEVVWNIERGLALTPDELGAAERARGRIVADACRFFRDFDLLLCPATIAPPFAVERRWLEALGEHRFDTYVDWLLIASAITLTGCPALSLPCGFTRDGLPVGLQMVAPPRGEARLLAVAAALEDALGLAGRVPVEPAA